MRIVSQLSHYLSGAAGLAILAACSSGSTPTSPGMRQFDRNGATPKSFAQQATRLKGRLPAGMEQFIRADIMPVRHFTNPTDRLPFNAFAFIAHSSENAVYVIDAGGSIIATLKGNGLSAPEGLSVTNHPRELYVANFSGKNILVYTPTGPSTSLNDAGHGPNDVAVDGRGNVAVSNSDGTVTCFAPGATSPTSTIRGLYRVALIFGKFDAAGDLYVIYNSAASPPQVGEIVGGCAGGTTITPLTTNNTFNYYVTGIQVESNGDIAIAENGSSGPPNFIYSYNPPVGGRLGSPVTTTSLTGPSFIQSFAFTPGSHFVLTAGAAPDEANVYAFPAGGSAIMSVNLPGQGLGYAEGAALSPSEEY